MARQLSPQQLFKQQQTISRVSSLATGAMGLMGSIGGMTQEAKNINTVAPGPTMDAFGKPVYNLGNFQSQVSAIKPQGATGGELLSGAMQGASAGSSFGLIGAGIGAAVGAIGSLFGGRRRKTLQRRRKDLATQNLASAQRMYNQGIESYNSMQSAQSLYNQQYRDNEERMNNVYQALS